ncbi:MAG TPA: pyrroline-5-carboxylate reductase [Hyphomonadaceae bacterium]|nr:pyrroline-5-carboxylate reductase [Hyphomonadaceae bacterium]HPN05990.1 pyrroline-5-carboxylate reductase [Hyphomonadaceae bacterium]
MSAGLRHAVLAGAGRMGSAMARGWLSDLQAAGVGRLSVIEPSPGEDVSQAAKDGLIALNRAPEVADILVLAVKPQGFAASVEGLKAWVSKDTLVVSIMAGVPIARIAASLGTPKVARAMPNTPGAIGMGATGYALSSACGDADGEATGRLLEPLGLVVGPLQESQMDAVTAVSGSGPAYVFLLVEALAAAGRSAGLDEPTANALARETIVGAGALLGDLAESPAELRKQVTSPGGTTAAALDVLMSAGGMPDLMRKAVDAAVRRGQELAKEAEKKA